MLSKDKQIENLLVAQAMFAEIPARKIDLGWWSTEPTRTAAAKGEDPVHTCGSSACFGGWIALHPHFQKQGVRPAETDGRPVIPSGRRYGIFGTSEVAEHLFGCPYMFSGNHWAAGDDASDRQEIFARIKRTLNRLLES